MIGIKTEEIKYDYEMDRIAVQAPEMSKEELERTIEKLRISCHGRIFDRNNLTTEYGCEERGDEKELIEMILLDSFKHSSQGIPYRCVSCGEILFVEEA